MHNPHSEEIIGLGVYTIQEAALYSGVSSRKLSRWLYGTRSTEPVIASQLRDEKLVSFLDLIQSKSIAEARRLDVPLQKIREAIDIAGSHYNIEFPLAHRFALVEFGNELHVHNHIADRITTVTGKQKHQTLMAEIVTKFMRDLEFNAEDIANKYIPFESNGIKITLNPKVQFGQPLVGNTGYRADILNKAYLAEMSYKSVADEFGVDTEEVETAVLYMKSLVKSAA